jgi:glycosyltransferase involved in cell wall biosynthesis
MTKAVVFVVGKHPLKEPGGGHSSYIRAHARAAVRAGYEPHLFCVGDSNYSTKTAFGTIHCVYSPWHPRRQLLIARHAPRLAETIVKFIETERQPQVIHGFGLWGYAGVIASERLTKVGIAIKPILSSYTTYEAEARSQLEANINSPLLSRFRFHAQHLWIQTVVERYERLAYQRSELVLINYESVRRLIEAKYGDRVRCRKIPYTCENAFDAADTSRTLAEQPAHKPSDIPVIITIASHYPRKGHDMLLEALKLMYDAGVSFRAYVIGGGPLLEEHRRRVRNLGIAGRTALTGVVDDVRPYLGSADIFVLPSLAEQSGSLAVIEAMQARLPIVAAAVDGLCEDLTNDHDALLVPPTSVSLASALTRLLADRQLRARLSRNALHTFRTRFSPDRFAHALGSIYEELHADLAPGSVSRLCS